MAIRWRQRRSRSPPSASSSVGAQRARSPGSVGRRCAVASRVDLRFPRRVPTPHRAPTAAVRARAAAFRAPAAPTRGARSTLARPRLRFQPTASVSARRHRSAGREHRPLDRRPTQVQVDMVVPAQHDEILGFVRPTFCLRTEMVGIQKAPEPTARHDTAPPVAVKDVTPHRRRNALRRFGQGHDRRNCHGRRRTPPHRAGAQSPHVSPLHLGRGSALVGRWLRDRCSVLMTIARQTADRCGCSTDRLERARMVATALTH